MTDLRLSWSRDDEGVITICATDENTGRIAEVADFWTKPMRERLGFRREYAKGVQQQLAETLVWNWNGPPGGDLDPSEELDRPGSGPSGMFNPHEMHAENERLREAARKAHAVLAQAMSAGWNAGGPTLDDTEAAFWSLDAALGEGGGE